jgi:hypothetical protein
VSERTRSLAAAVLVALLAFLPFLRGALSGASFYFRDLSLHFFPLRRFALEGLRQGELRLWNPLVHEGVPLSLPAVGYPIDLVQLVSPHEAFLSLVLALHVPLAALACFALARGLGLGVSAAAGSASTYALGGFSLASLNLYIHAQAAAWAPLVVLGLVRLLAGAGRRTLALSALVTATALSTTGVEIAGQAILAGVVLGARRGPQLGRRAFGVLLALGLSLLLAAPVLVLVGGQVEGSARAHGFPTDVVLAHSVHPFALVQTLVGGLFGDLGNLASDWWGDNFFPRGFPYVVSLYLGAVLVALAAVGASSRLAFSGRLALLVALGLVASLGRYAGLAELVEAFPPAHAFRFPVKAFFTVQLGCALLAGLGLETLGAGRRWKALALVAAGLGGVLAAAPLLPRLWPAGAMAFAAAFLPPRIAPVGRAVVLDRVLADAALGGLVALGAALVALAAARGRLASVRAAGLVAALAVADLLRTGAGLNPMVSSRFYQASVELEERLAELRAGRVFTCSVETSPAYLVARQARGRDHEAWSFAALLETLTPAFNLAFGVPSALSPDLTMLVPTARVLTPEEAACRDPADILPRLREAAVSHVLSLDPLEHAELVPAFTTQPARIAPLQVHAYRLSDARPRLSLEGPGRATSLERTAGRLELDVEAEAEATLVVGETPDPGWSARVDGQPRPLELRGRHLAVAVPAGRSRVQLEYRPRGLRAACGASLLALVVLVLLARRATGPRASSS